MAWTESKWWAVLRDFMERAGWSAGQVFVATLLAGGTVTTVSSLPWRYALTLAFSAAVSSLILTAVQYAARITKLPFWLDLLVRLAKTFLASVAASIAAASVFDVTTFDWETALNVAVLATLTAFGKGLLAREPAAAPQGPATPEASPAPRQSSPSTLPLETYVKATSR
jgi:hypothetical protein